MAEAGIDANQFGPITQVIGVAYTYQVSLAIRRSLTRKVTAHHSSQIGYFSYFYKGDSKSIVTTDDDLYLRSDPATGQTAIHWPEPELAALLGERHEIIAYTLANDLTAITIEARGRTQDIDGTYLGKAWFRSGSLGPRFVAASTINDTSKLLIGLRVIRGDRTVYQQNYSTSKRLRPFSEIPDAIVSYYTKLGSRLPPSKRIVVGTEGFLLPGTVIMLGTGLIVRQKYYCEDGDTITIYNSSIGELTNTVVVRGESI
jgi:2-keto-4-pentenoate hydratase/2-oxohepta-3-ene-1,7-dioic acid hydratase in catechol pathway